MANHLSTKPNRFYPNIPAATQDLASLQNSVEQIRAAMLTHERRDNNYQKSFVRFEELVALGLIDSDGNPTGGSDGGAPSPYQTPWLSDIDGNGYTLSNVTLSQLSGLDVLGTAQFDSTINVDGLATFNACIRISGGDNYVDFCHDNTDLNVTSGVPEPSPGDPSFSNVVVLLQFEGNDGDTATVDTGPNAYTVTRELGAGASIVEIDTSNAAVGSGSMRLNHDNLFGGWSGYTVDDPAIGRNSTDEWTVEGWFYYDGTESTASWYLLEWCDRIYIKVAGNQFNINSRTITGTAGAPGEPTYNIFTNLSGPVYTDNTWTHVAFCRDNTDDKLYLYINGVKATGNSGGEVIISPTSTQGGGSNAVHVGHRQASGSSPPGDIDTWIDGIRVTEGVCRYPGGISFTPGEHPTEEAGTPITPAATDINIIGMDVRFDYESSIEWQNSADVDIEMLNFSGVGEVDPVFGNVLLQLEFEGNDGDITTTDSSSYQHPVNRVFGGNAVTVDIDTSEVKIGTSSTFILNSSSTSCGGWQVPTGQPALDIDDNADWTVEFWIKVVDGTDGAVQYIFDAISGVNSGISIEYQLDNFRGQVNGLFFNQVNSVIVGTWQHVALCRDGTSVYLYVDGVLLETETIGTANVVHRNTSTVNIGNRDGTNDGIQGSGAYLDNLRWTHGVARYPGGVSFTPPDFTVNGTAGETFFVGDPAYKTQIDGSTICITGDLEVSGTTLLEQTLNVLGATQLQSSLEVFGTTELYQSLRVHESAQFDSTINVDGHASFRGDVTMYKFVDLDGNEDPNWDSVALLIRWNGTDGATTNFVEDSSYGNIVVPTNGAQLDTAQSKFGGASGLLDNTGAPAIADYFRLNNYDGMVLAGNDFTVECWIRLAKLPTTSVDGGFTIIAHYQNSGNRRCWWFKLDDSNALEFAYSTDGITVDNVCQTAHTFAIDTWYAVAAVRSGNSVYLYVDGTRIGTHTVSGDIYNGTLPAFPYIGYTNTSSGFRSQFDGWIDELRLTNGVARYTGSTYTLQTEEFDNTQNPVGSATLRIGYTGENEYQRMIHFLEAMDVTDGVTTEAGFYIDYEGIPNSPFNTLHFGSDKPNSAGTIFHIGERGEFRIEDNLNHNVTLSSTNHPFQVGPDTSQNLRIGRDEIQVVNNSAKSPLDIQPYGGSVAFFETDHFSGNSNSFNVYLGDAGRYYLVGDSTNHNMFFQFETVGATAGSANLELWPGFTTEDFIFKGWDQVQIQGGNFRIGDSSTMLAYYDFDITSSVGPATLNFDSCADWNITGLTNEMFVDADLRVSGDLKVDGTFIQYNSNAVDPPTEDVTLEVYRGGVVGTPAIRWNETNDRWEYTNDGTTYYEFMEMADGTATDNSLRWDGSNWVESSVFKLTDSTGILNVDATAINSYGGFYCSTNQTAAASFIGLENIHTGTAYVELSANGPTYAFGDHGAHLSTTTNVGPFKFEGSLGIHATMRDISTTRYFDISDGTHFRIEDDAETSYAEMYHDGTDFVIDSSSINLLSAPTIKGNPTATGIWGFTGQLAILNGADTAAFTHDGTDFNTSFAATAAWNIRDGVVLKIFDASDTDSAGFSHDGTDFITDFTNTGAWRLTNLGIGGFTVVNAGINLESTAPIIQMKETDGALDEKLWTTFIDGSVWQFGPATDAGIVRNCLEITRTADSADEVKFANGVTVRIENSTSTDYADFSHDGTDFNTAFTNTADWNVTNARLVPDALLHPTEDVTATNVITAAESGKIFYLNAAGGFTSTLPAPEAGLRYRFIVKTAPTTAYIITTNAGANILYGTVNEITATAGISVQAQDTLNFVASASLIGDWVEFTSDGTNWYVNGITQVDGGITVSVT